MARLVIYQKTLKNIPSALNQCMTYSTSKETLQENYQYLQRSEVPTLHFQGGLPRLPIPKLEKTCERYLAAQKPLLPVAEAYAKTEANVKRFLTSSGKVLNDILVEQDKQNKHTSYISAPWSDMYLKDRKPLPLNYNPFITHVPNPNPAYETQLLKATNLVISSLKFMRSLRANILKPEIFYLQSKTEKSSMFPKVCKSLPPSLAYIYAYLNKAYPLDMSQYNNLFNSTRVPELDKDLIVQDTRATHMVAMRKGHFYVFDVLDASGNILPPRDILAKIKQILDDPRPPADLPLGILTSENRNVWATARHMLIKLGNEKTLRLIDSAIYNLVLDDVEVKGNDEKLSRNFLLGDGKNRWFDKSVSLIVTKDGTSSVNFEHAWGDGVAVLRFFNDIWYDSTNNPEVHPDSIPDPNVTEDDVRLLDINLDEQMTKIIKSAKHNYDKMNDSLNIDILKVDGIGKNICKKSKVSPDAVMQLGFQSAYYKLAGKFVATYESCSTAAFKHGRTETVRPCTMATKNFCDSLHIKKLSLKELRPLISQCSEVHSQLTKEAAMGQGFDRHLFVLKYIAEKQGRPTPSIFEDSSYLAINYNILSTSTLASPTVYAGGFGPVVTDGFGIGYTIQDDSLGVMVTSYRGNANGSDYQKALKKSYEEIIEVLSI